MDKIGNILPKKYDFWYIKEIMEQPESILKVLNYGARIKNNVVKLQGLDSNKDILSKVENIILLGCGTSFNACLIGVSYFKDLCNFNCVMSFDGADFCENDIPKKGITAIILVSQSGETMDLYKCLEIAKKKNIITIGITNVVDSLISREVNSGIYLNIGREISVASTKSFISQTIMLSLIALWFTQTKKISRIKREGYLNSLRNLSNDFENSLSICQNNKKLLTNFMNKNNCYVIGRGCEEFIAREGALKIKEISYVHAEGYNSSSLKHGPFALLNRDFPTILICSKNKYYKKINTIYSQIKSRGSKILFITTDEKCNKKNTIILKHNKYYNEILCIIPLQLLSYYLAIKKKLNPDKPRNLAKVVTVE